jgi:hypothetical protein
VGTLRELVRKKKEVKVADSEKLLAVKAQYNFVK